MKNHFYYISLLLLILSFSACNSVTSSENQDRSNSEYQLVWSDEFEYNGLPDSTLWAYDTEGNEAGWGNREAQFYTEADTNNALVKDGMLHIIARMDSMQGKEFTSARLISKADWKYARVEVNARIPDGRGTWSAIWMMPGGWTFNDGNWPDIGEIDIMEHVGWDPQIVHASAHSRDYQWQKDTQKTGVIDTKDATHDFHTYAMEWDADVMKAYVDDSLYFTYQNEYLGEEKWPYDKPFYLILNLAVGGAWGSVKGIDREIFPQTMEIDWVRIYTKD